MAHLPSRDSIVAVSAAGTTYSTVGGVKDIGDWAINGDTIDITDHDSGVYKEFLAGRYGMSFSMNGNYDETDAGQDILMTAVLARSTIYFRLRPSTGTGKYQFIATGIVTSFKTSAPNDAAVPFSCDVQLTGALTHSAQ